MGFQSCSRKMTVSAAVRFRPRPPTCSAFRPQVDETGLRTSNQKSVSESEIQGS